MIPERYWKILRSWYWLIGGIALGFAALAVIVVPQVRGDSEPGHTAAVTLGLTRLVSSDGSVATVGGEGDGELLVSYTNSVVARGNTPQFIKELSDRLAAKGLAVDQTTLARKLTFAADPAFFRVSITAKAGNENDAEMIAQTAADLMVEDVTAEETRVRTDVSQSLLLQQQRLTDRLNEVYADRTTELAAIGQPAVTEALNNLIALGGAPDVTTAFNTLVADLSRINSDPQLAVLNSQAASIEAQLAALAATQSTLSDDSLSAAPMSIIDPVDTVELPAAEGLRVRDMLVMGGIAGLVVGWLAAVMLDGLFSRERRRARRRAGWKPAKVRVTDG